MDLKKIGKMEAIALLVMVCTNQIILNFPKKIILDVRQFCLDYNVSHQYYCNDSNTVDYKII